MLLALAQVRNVNRCPAARLVHFTLQPSCVEWLGIGARSEWRWLIASFIDPKLLRAEGPPGGDSHRKTYRDQDPLVPREPRTHICFCFHGFSLNERVESGRPP